MKMEIKTDVFRKAVTTVSGIVPKNSVSPSCTYIKLEGHEGALSLVGTDAEVSIRSKIAAESLTDPGEILLPAEKLRMIVSESDAETIAIETDGTTARISSGRSRFVLNGLEGKDFPPVPSGEDMETVTMEARDLAEVIARTQIAVSREPSRYAINGVYFQIEDKTLELAATDGKRLANAMRKVKSKKNNPVKAIVPPKMIAEMRKVCESLGEQEVKIGANEKYVLLQTAETTLISLLVEGTFPKYKEVIPTDLHLVATIDRAAWQAKLRQAIVLTSEETRSVTLKFSPKTLVMESRIPELGEAKIEMDVEYDGPEVALAFDTRFLRDVLEVLKLDRFKLEIKDANRPGVIRDGREYTYVMMPMKVKD